MVAIDFHGKSKPDIFMGIGKGDLRIENKYIGNWISKIDNIIN